MATTLVTITFQEEEHIRDWYRINSPLADEVVILDTGSTDRTVEIAKELGIKVFPYEWDNHYGNARNAAISHCTGDWIIFLDCDVYLDEKDFPRIREWMDDKNVMAYSCGLVEHFSGWFNAENTNKIPYEHIFMFRNHKGFEYRRRIHERIEHSIKEEYPNGVKTVDIFRHHDSTAIRGSEHKRTYFKCLRAIQELEEHIKEIDKKGNEVLQRDAYLFAIHALEEKAMHIRTLAYDEEAKLKDEYDKR